MTRVVAASRKRMDFDDANLPAGDYEVEWRLGTTLFDNNANDAMFVQTAITARENIDKTESMQLLRAEMHALYLNATNRTLPEQTRIVC